MSDLQCPARFLVLAREMAASGQHQRPEQDEQAWVPAGERVADVLDLAHRLSVDDVRRREPAALDRLRELADDYRGETVVVLALGPADVAEPLEVLVDADAITCRLLGAH